MLAIPLLILGSPIEKKKTVIIILCESCLRWNGPSSVSENILKLNFLCSMAA